MNDIEKEISSRNIQRGRGQMAEHRGINVINEHDLLTVKGLHLDVWKVSGETGDRICVCYAGAETKSGVALVGEFGTGNFISEAINDYYRKIKGKTLVFNANGKSRYEIMVI